jgi:hypothetical protein
MSTNEPTREAFCRLHFSSVACGRADQGSGRTIPWLFPDRVSFWSAMPMGFTLAGFEANSRASRVPYKKQDPATMRYRQVPKLIA